MATRLYSAGASGGSPADNPLSGVSDPSPRRRLTREQRLAQLMEVSWQLVRHEGTDALTLGRLAEAAGVTKPVVYDHFGTRHGLLAALYRNFDKRQALILDAALAASEPDLESKAHVIAANYIGCVLAEGRELPDVLAALSASPELAAIKKECQQSYIAKCLKVLSPFTPTKPLSKAALWAMLGAADALSNAVFTGDISEADAYSELRGLIIAMVGRA
ncbi:AcrR family transcriptional regulator [Pseudochelatococcus contaminans]|uniref:AcrR family transcriptional regulator n=2 Tax=Pseudochelatococcus contaminans TaxID=1538103 RepID=A0A7W6EH92_9HYPH|nr:AcrR family transcriptional regulator [Pseudochelatococcus contaminans]